MMVNIIFVFGVLVFLALIIVPKITGTSKNEKHLRKKGLITTSIVKASYDRYRSHRMVGYIYFAKVLK
jgi:hypothetical protein